MRLAVAGVPSSGKTTLARTLTRLCPGDNPLLQTDSLIGGVEWSELSLEVSLWFDREAFVIEGVAVPRALRKWLASNQTGRPCEVLIWIDEPYLELSNGAARMAKGCRTVLREILPELMARGVDVWPHRCAPDLLPRK